MKNEVNKTGKKGKEKKLIIISALALVLTTIMCIAFIAAVEAVTTTNSDLDAASLSLSLFKKKPTTPTTGRAIDEFGNKIATVTVKAEEEVGRVRDDFYGVNIGWAGSNLSYIDIDDNGISDTLSNYEWHRNALKESKISTLRINMGLAQNSLSEGIFNNYSIFTNNKNINTKKSLVNWAKKNDMKLILSARDMPSWLADTKTGLCNWTSSNSTCPPSNYTKWGELVVNYLQEVGCTPDVCIIEVWNEPNLAEFWLDNISNREDSVISKEYNKMYNSTYLAIKNIWPTMKVGGPTTTGMSQVSRGILSNFIGNFSKSIDFISFHDYLYQDGYKDYNSKLSNDYNLIFEIIEKYNINTPLYISEFNIWNNHFIFNKPKIWSMQLGLAYEATLNKYPNNVSLVEYQWTWNTVRKLDYNGIFSMVSEPQLDNAYYPSYNVTKDFAHYHAGGNMIVNSSSNNESIKSVASLNPKGIWHITVINTATNNIRVNVDVSSTGVKAVKDLATGTIYPVNDGIVDVGILTEYDVKHYEGIVNYEPPVAKTSSEERSSSGGGSSNTGNKLVSVKPDTSVVIPTSKLLINTETTTTTSESKEEKKVYGPVKANEEDIRLYQEEYENELQGNSHIGTLSPAVSNKSYLTIAIIILGSIICTLLIISIIYKRKKREAEKVKRLMDWVDKARALGYTSEKMKEMLAEYNWNKDLVDKVVGG